MPQIFPFCTSKINQANISSKFLSKPKTALLNLINQFNNYSNKQNNENNQNLLDCKYRNIEFFKNFLIHSKLTLFHSFVLIFVLPARKFR